MKIGILGSGNMGRALGMRWAMNGHEVFFGGRSIEKTKGVAGHVQHGSQYGTLQEAAAFGDVLLHTIRDVLPSEIVSDTDSLAGKVLIDLNNDTIPDNFEYVPISSSFAEKFQADVPKLKVVKAFNMFAMEMFEHDAETIAKHGVSVFIAGNDSGAKEMVSQLAVELGFNAIDSGLVNQARLIEGMGDFIRLLMIEKGMGAFTALSASSLPRAETSKLGGRQSSNFK
jgi:predicted dinucleotide-binding enzyme